MAEGVEKGQVELSGAVGLSTPNGSFGNIAKTGFQLLADAGYYASPFFVAGARISIHSYNASDEVIAATRSLVGDPNADVKFSIFQFSGYWKLLFDARNVSPFIRVGLGIYSLKAEVDAIGGSGSDSESGTGFSIGGGFQIRGERADGGFIEVMYHNVSSEGSTTSFVDISAGITLFMGGR